MVDWDSVLQKLRSYPPDTQNLQPPCPRERVIEEESRLGQMPHDLDEMLRRFNGGELFVDAIPLVTIFGLTHTSNVRKSDWFIDRFTPKWRSSGERAGDWVVGMTNYEAKAATGDGRATRAGDWVVGMTNYGGLIILGNDSLVREWDTSQRKMMDGSSSFDEWIEKTISEGADYLQEE